MITASLNGGLGNQLFQVAAAYSLAKEIGTECAFNFNVPTKNQGNSPLKYRDNLYKNLKSLPDGWKAGTIYVESCYDFRPLPRADNVSLKGYFQREAYFAQYAKEIVDLFTDQEVISTLKCKYHNLFRNSVSVHVRRGDYLRFASVYHIKDNGYYDRALKKIDELASIKNIFVVSDDIEWCRENFTDPRMIFVVGQPDYYDLLLMTLCSHNIIANSSFSYWGAWLGETPQKRIISPTKWFINESHNTETQIPSRWIKL